MNKLREIIFRKPSDKINEYTFVWNMIGSFSYAIVTPVVLIIVTRFLGSANAGIFSIAYSISQLLMVIGSFEIRPLHVTDIERRYSFSQYYICRIITILLMICVGILYCLAIDGDVQKKIVIFLLILYRIADCIGDVIEGEFQRNSQMYVSGKLLFIRTILPNVIMVLLIVVGTGLIYSLLGLLCSSIIIMFFEMSMYSKEYMFIDRRNIVEASRQILFLAFPIFIISFLQGLLTNMPKYYIDWLSGDYSAQLIYSIIFMPVFVINLISGLIFKPYLTELATLYEIKEKTKFENRVRSFCMIIISITIMCVFLGYSVVLPTLEILYNIELYQYRGEMVILMLGGGISALSIFIYYILIIIKQQRVMFLVYLISVVIAFVINYYLIIVNNIFGACLGYLVNFIVLTLMLFWVFKIKYKSEK